MTRLTANEGQGSEAEKRPRAEPPLAQGLRVALIATQFPTPAETFVTGRAKVLVELGCHVSAHSLRNAHPRHASLAEERGVAGVPRTHTTAASVLGGSLSALARPALLARFLAWVVRSTSDNPKHLLKCLVLTPRVFEILADFERDPPDVVHAEWCHYPSLVLWLVQQRLPGTVRSISLVAHDLDERLGCTIDATRAAQVIRTSTEENVAQVVEFTGVSADRVEVIYNGVDLEAVDAAVAAHPKVQGRVVVVARLAAEKRVDHAIRAFAVAAEPHPEATLHILGEGPERQRLEGLARSLGLVGSVRFLGHVSHQQVIEEAARAQVLVLMSETERLPNVVKEGMAARCVCLATRTNGIDELMQHGVTGFVLEHEAIEEAGRLIAWGLSEHAAAAEMGAAAREFVGIHFDHPRNVSRYATLWLAAQEKVKKG